MKKVRWMACACVRARLRYDRGQNTRVPSAAQTSDAETRILMVIRLEGERICPWLIGGGYWCGGGGSYRFCACARPRWILGNLGLEPRVSLGSSTDRVGGDPGAHTVYIHWPAPLSTSRTITRTKTAARNMWRRRRFAAAATNAQAVSFLVCTARAGGGATRMLLRLWLLPADRRVRGGNEIVVVL